MSNPNADLPESYPVSFSDPRRKLPRWYLHDGSTPLESQSCGIAAQLMVTGLLFDKKVGTVVIKDIGPGGVGFLAPVQYVVPDLVCLTLLQGTLLECVITHRRPIGRNLCFYGARWADPESVELGPVISHWRDHFMAPEGAASTPIPGDLVTNPA